MVSKKESSEMTPPPISDNNDVEAQSPAISQEAKTEPEISALPRERIVAENEVFKRVFADLQRELAKIDETYGAEAEASDPVKKLSGEVSALKNDIQQIMRFLEQSVPPRGNGTAPAQPWMQPVQQAVFPATAPIPYIQTPNISPIMPQPLNIGRM